MARSGYVRTIALPGARRFGRFDAIARAIVAVGALSLSSGGTSDKVRTLPALSAAGVDALPHRVLVASVAHGPAQTERCDREDQLCPQQAFFDFVLYEDGLVVYRTGPVGASLMMRGHLTPDGAKAVAEEIYDSGFARLRESQTVGYGGDIPGAIILLRHGGWWYRAEADGVDRFGQVHGLPVETLAPSFASALHRFETFHAPDETPWVPDEFLLGFREATGNETGKAADWPNDLPPLGAAGAVGTLNKGFVVCASRHFDLARAVHAKAGSGPVRSQGRSWLFTISAPAVPEYQYLSTVSEAFANN